MDAFSVCSTILRAGGKDGEVRDEYYFESY